MRIVPGIAQLVTLFLLALCAGCAHLPAGGAGQKPAADQKSTAEQRSPVEQRPFFQRDPAAEVASAINGASFPADQLLAVIAEGKETSRARLYLLERGDSGWELKAGPLSAMIGRNGFAAPGAKREGDGRTPGGLFPLEYVFGYATAAASAMPYRQATGDDLWVNDPNSPDYNRWVKKGDSTAASFERMLLPDRRYRHGIVVGYNRNPVIKGKGSAIFVHVWSGEGGSTSGCVALDEAELVRVIGWLDPAKRPMILLGDRSDLALLPGLSALATADRPAVRNGGADLERQVRAKLAGAGGRAVEYRGTGGFFGMAVAVPKAVEAQMRLKKSWREGCPVPISSLDYLALGYWGFDGASHVGELVVHRTIALATIKAFADLYAQRFPIERMELIDRYDADDDRSMAANNTSAFNCREVTGRPGVLSNHSYGSAIDINPVQNPYLIFKAEPLKALGWNGSDDKVGFLERLGYPRDDAGARYCGEDPARCQVLPPGGLPFLSRESAPGLLLPGPAVQAFTSRGFDWGGTWRATVDYQHMEVKREKLR